MNSISAEGGFAVPPEVAQASGEPPAMMRCPGLPYEEDSWRHQNEKPGLTKEEGERERYGEIAYRILNSDIRRQISEFVPFAEGERAAWTGTESNRRHKDFQDYTRSQNDRMDNVLSIPATTFDLDARRALGA